MTNFKSFIGGLVIIVIALVLYYKAPHIDTYFSKEKKSQLLSPTEALAIISDSTFKFPIKISIKRFSTGNVETLASNKISNTPIFHRDKVYFQPNGTITVKFNSNYEIELVSTAHSSETAFELNDPSDVNSPVYINITSGNFNVLKRGQIGKLYLVKDQSITLPERYNKTPAKVLVLASLQVPKMNTLTETPPLTVDEETQTDATSRKMDVNNIEEILRSQAPLFQKCQTNSMRESSLVKGKLLLEFSVLPSGTISTVKVIESSLKDKKLEDCSMSVVKRLSFTKFEGEELTFSYPIEYK